MWDSLALPWRVCLEEAWTSYRAGSFPIGAALVDASGAIISRGRNRIFEREQEGRTVYGQRLAHAELNALVVLDQADVADRLVRLGAELVDPRTCVLYSTHEPCPLCTGAIRMFPIGEVRYASRDSAAGSIGLLDASPFMRRAGIRVVGPERDDLETVIAALHVEAALRTTRGAGVIEYWLGTVPAAVELGRALHASGDLWRLCRTGRPIAEVVDFMVERTGRR